MSHLVVSPHLDDAVLSFGGTIAGATDLHIATVLAGLPPAWRWPTPFDNASGFSDSRNAVVARRAEDEAAAAEIGARTLHLGFLDGQYGTPNDPEFVVAVLVELLAGHEQVAVPLGLAHPDHRFVARCCRAAMRVGRYHGRVFVVYAELPAAKLWPGHVKGAVRGWERSGWQMEPFQWPASLEAKRRAWERYESQRRFPELAWENLTEERGWLTRFNGED